MLTERCERETNAVNRDSHLTPFVFTPQPPHSHPISFTLVDLREIGVNANELGVNSNQIGVNAIQTV